MILNEGGNSLPTARYLWVGLQADWVHIEVGLKADPRDVLPRSVSSSLKPDQSWS
jgi:hypothetical protein